MMLTISAIKQKTIKKSQTLTSIIIVSLFFVVLPAYALDETFTETLISNEFQGGGVGQGLHCDDASTCLSPLDDWIYALPFPFKIYDTEYVEILLGSEGGIIFDTSDVYDGSDQMHNIEGLTYGGPFIAPLGHEYTTHGREGDDIYITESTDNLTKAYDHVIVRWQTTTRYSWRDLDPANFELVLYRNGNAKFNYAHIEDAGAWSVQAGVGFGLGDGIEYTTSIYDDTQPISLLSDAQTSAWGIFGPEALTSVPANRDVGVPLDQKMHITFDKPVQQGSGLFEIRRSIDDTLVEPISVASLQISGWGSDTLTISPSAPFESGVDYYVTISSDFAKDTDDQFFPGINDKTRWSFTAATDADNFSFVDTLETTHFIDTSAIEDVDLDTTTGDATLLSYDYWGMGETPKYDVIWNNVNPGDWMTRSIVRVDSSDNPIIAFREGHYPPSPTPDSRSIGVAQWDGSAWTSMSGADRYDTLFEMARSYNVWLQEIIIDTNDQPVVFGTTYHSGWGGSIPERRLMVARWNGSMWTQMDGVTAGPEDLFNSTSTSTRYDVGESNSGDLYVLMYDAIARDIFYTTWNGNDWVYADGVTLGWENITNSGSLGAAFPQASFDQSDTPYITWATGGDVFLTHWNGSAWTQTDGVTVGSENISNSSGSSYLSTLIFDSLNNPLILFEDNSAGSNQACTSQWNGVGWMQMDDVTSGMECIAGSIGTSGMFIDEITDDVIVIHRSSSGTDATRWNGSAWTHMDRTTPGSENISSPAPNAYAYVYTLGTKNPIVLWEVYDDGYRIYATRWNNGGWTQMDGTTLGIEDVSNGTGYMYPAVAYNSYDQPIFAWGSSDGGTNSQIHVSRYAPHALSPQTLTSTKVSGMIDDISTVSLNATDDTPGNAQINYSVTNDGGAHWHSVTKGQVFTFPFVGNDLRWKADLYEGSTPTLYDITLSYSQQVVTPPIDPPITPPTPDITPELTKITDVGRKNLTLKAQIDNATYYNKELTFTVKITNKDNGKDETREFTKTTDSSGKVSLAINGLKDNTNYSFRILFTDGTYTSTYSNKEEVKTKTDITNTDQTPSDLEATADSYTTMKITWKDNAQGENGYIIERKAYNETVFTPLTNLPKNTQEYTDTGLYAGSTYTYRVRAYHGNNYTGYSNEDHDQTPVYVKTESTDPQPVEPTIPEPVPPIEEPEPLPPTEPEPPQRPAPQQPVTQEPIENDTTEDEEESDNDTNASILTTTYTKAKDFAQTEEATNSLKTATLIGTIGGILLTAAATSLPLITTASATGGFSLAAFGLLGLFAKRKEEGQWGSVFDVKTKRQLPGIKVLINQAQGTLTDSTNTNAHGQYGFLPQPGTYTLDIENEDLILDRVNTQDDLYGNVYNGQPFQTDPQSPVSMSIAARSNTNWSAYADKKIKRHTSFFRSLLKGLLSFFFYGGFVFVLAISLLNPITLNLVFLGIYAFFLIITLFKRKKRSYGVIRSHETKKPIPFAIVSLYDSAQSTSRKAFAVTDALGRYFLLTDDGDYFMKVEGQELGGKRISAQDSVRVKGGNLREDVEV